VVREPVAGGCAGRERPGVPGRQPTPTWPACSASAWARGFGLRRSARPWLGVMP